MRRNEITFLIFSLLLAAIVGGLVGDVIGGFLPEGSARTLFKKNIQVGVEPTTADFFSISFTIGFMFKINFVSVLFLVMVLIYFRWWYI
ncbi:MAG: DUF4321 domain-containing protein [candidate division Zixibacteria bacterium]|nr:DUF4321 domain-containing protein [candidate division Zixibacteria bacterium]